LAVTANSGHQLRGLPGGARTKIELRALLGMNKIFLTIVAIALAVLIAAFVFALFSL
jgi:hypothetical protein